jgi:hypothetical protein
MKRSPTPPSRRKERMEKAIRQDRVDTLRKLAKKAEAIERNNWTERAKIDAFFTCVRVNRELGATFAHEYESRFCPNHGSEVNLWSDPLCMSRRVLSLCFMAAMVEAGDA